MTEDLLQILKKAYEDGYRYAEISITLMKGQEQLSQSSRGRLVAEANRIDLQNNSSTNTIVAYNNLIE